jgi:hypothetical protein
MDTIKDLKALRLSDNENHNSGLSLLRVFKHTNLKYILIFVHGQGRTNKS